MAYSLTGAMFLLSYLFPFSDSSMDGSARVIIPTNGMVNVSSGTTIRIPCSLDDKNSPVLRGQWNKNVQAILKLQNGQIVFNRDYQAVTKGGRFDLIIRDIQARDKGVYQCVGSTKDDELHFSKTLNLNIIDEGSSDTSGEVKVITPKNNAVAVEPGTRVVIKCPVIAKKLRSALWQKDLVQIGELKAGKAVFDRFYRSPSPVPGVFNLVIEAVRSRDKGIYQCVGYDNSGKLIVGATVTLRINSPAGNGPFGGAPPVFKHRPDQSTFVFTPDNKLKDVPVGKTVVIRCPLIQNASDVLNATWEKNWLQIGTLANGKAAFDPPRPAVNISVPVGVFDLVIANVRIRDEGTYQCINLFSEGEKFSKTLKLRVPVASEPPRLLQMLSGLSYPVDRIRKVMVRVGRPFVLKCEAKRGHPGANIVWRVGGALLVSNHTGPFRVQDFSGRISHKSIIEGKKEAPIFRSTQSILEVTLPERFNNSLIMCMAVNPMAPKKRALTRVLMVESDTDPNGQASLASCVVLSVLLSIVCRMLLL